MFYITGSMKPSINVDPALYGKLVLKIWVPEKCATIKVIFL